jgi:RNA polymerase sigma-70 factor (ECF subfamily)
VIKWLARGHEETMRHDALTLLSRGQIADGAVACEAAADRRLRGLIDAQYDFIWRSLRRLGVADGDVDDAAQQVFVIAARKLAAIRVDRERSFLFQTALRVAADCRRTCRRRREVAEDQLEHRDHWPDPAPAPDDMVDLRRARARLAEILEEMPLDVRAVFVLFELDEMTMAEISSLLDLPEGTVASRLRRARIQFREAAARIMGAPALRGAGT